MEIIKMTIKQTLTSIVGAGLIALAGCDNQEKNYFVINRKYIISCATEKNAPAWATSAWSPAHNDSSGHRFNYVVVNKETLIKNGLKPEQEIIYQTKREAEKIIDNWAK